MKRLVVVGGGIAGLAAVRAVERSGAAVEVTLVERDARLGGKIRTDEKDGYLLEAGPDGILTRKPAALRLVEELGMSGALVPRTPRTTPAFVAHERRLAPLPEGLSGMVPARLEALRASPLLTESGKRRALEEPAIPARGVDGDESVASFMTRRYGEEPFRLLIEPLVSGIYAADAEMLSVAATIPQLRALELRHGSVTAGLAAAPRRDDGGLPPFLSLGPGMETLVRAAVGDLADARILRNAAASVVGSAGRRFVVAAGGEDIAADAVVLAVPAGEVARLTDHIAPDLAALTARIPFAGSAIVHLAWREEDVHHPLDGYGYLIPAVEGSLLLGCTWASRKWPARSPAGTVLLRFHAGRFGREVDGVDDDALVSLCRDETAATLGITAAPILTHVHRWDRSLPQYNAGHLDILGGIDRALAARPGLFVAGSSYRGVGISDCIESGVTAARAALRHLSA